MLLILSSKAAAATGPLPSVAEQRVDPVLPDAVLPEPDAVRVARDEEALAGEAASLEARLKIYCVNIPSLVGVNGLSRAAINHLYKGSKQDEEMSPDRNQQLTALKTF